MAIRVHELKIAKEYADSVHFGDKTFEVRLNDRGFQKGDIVRFKPLSKSGPSVDTRHPLYDKEYEITYVLGSFYGLAQGYVAFGIKPIGMFTKWWNRLVDEVARAEGKTVKSYRVVNGEYIDGDEV